jgi:cytochrome c oxidase cbb3-type subunit 3
MCKTLCAIVALTAVFLWGQGGRNPAGPRDGIMRICPGSGNPCVEVPADAYKRGQEQFVQSCTFCHGRNGAGGASGPNLNRSEVIRHDTNGEQIGKLIRDGRPDKGMPAIALAGNQITDVAAYLRGRVAESDKISGGPPGRNYEAKKLLTGSVELGKAYFNGAGECASCHSPSGDLKGIATRYAPTFLQARFLYPARNRTTATATVTDASGKQFSGEVLQNDAFDIAIKTTDGWYRSWPVSAVKIEVRDPLAKHVELLHKFTTADMHNLFAYLETLK